MAAVCLPLPQRLFGPDPHGFHAAHDSRTATNLAWLQAWLRGCAARGVPIEGVTHHEYIEVGNGSFADAAKLDLSAAIGRVTQQAVRAVDRQVGIWAGEIGPHNGGSPVCSHASMRWAVYGDSIWYADALGAKARAGYAGFCRQDYIGADCAPIWGPHPRRAEQPSRLTRSLRAPCRGRRHAGLRLRRAAWRVKAPPAPRFLRRCRKACATARVPSGTGGRQS
jgi:hypothetical protein